MSASGSRLQFGCGKCASQALDRRLQHIHASILTSLAVTRLNRVGGRYVRLLCTAWRSAFFAFCAALLVATLAAVPRNVEADPPPLPVEAIELERSTLALPEVKDAVARFEQHDFDGCLAQLVKARKAHPDLPPAEVLFAKLAFTSHQKELIRPALERAAVADPEDPEIYIVFGNLALAEGRLTDASLHFEKAKALAAAGRWTGEQRARYERLCCEGSAQLAEFRHDWRGARAALELWLKLQPSNGAARHRLGRALFHLRQSKAAYEELKRACKDDPRLEPAAVAMGWLCTATGNLTKAEEWMEYAVKNDGKSPAVQTGVAAWLVEQGRVNEALTHLDAAAKLDPKSSKIMQLQGLVARQQKDFATAERVFQAMVDESPSDAWPRNQLALVLAEQADPAKRKRAMDLAELSMRLGPKAPDSLATLATVDYRLGRNEDAQKILEALLASGNATSDSAYILARVREARGQRDGVPTLLKAALSAPGIFVYRKDAQEWLNHLTAKPKSHATRIAP